MVEELPRIRSHQDQLEEELNERKRNQLFEGLSAAGVSRHELLEIRASLLRDDLTLLLPILHEVKDKLRNGELALDRLQIGMILDGLKLWSGDLNDRYSIELVSNDLAYFARDEVQSIKIFAEANRKLKLGTINFGESDIESNAIQILLVLDLNEESEVPVSRFTIGGEITEVGKGKYKSALFLLYMASQKGSLDFEMTPEDHDLVKDYFGTSVINNLDDHPTVQALLSNEPVRVNLKMKPPVQN